MNRFFWLILSLAGFMTGCVRQKTPVTVQTQALTITDVARKRDIPVTLYNAAALPARKKQLVIISACYQCGSNVYSFLAEKLAGMGYFVVGIQHDLASDPPIATEGDLYKLRMPVWESGVQNIQAVIAELHRAYGRIDTKNLILIGHSMGGDISMLYVRQQPDQVAKAITLDHRRMPVPRLSKPAILTIRADEFEADKGVLPTPAEQKKTGIKIIRMTRVKHGDLSDIGSPELKEEVRNMVVRFIERGR